MSTTTAPTSEATITVLDHPSALPRRRPKTSRNSAADEVTRPPRSMPRDSGSRYSRIRRSASASATAPTGTLTKKIHCQPSPSVSAPPMSGPTAAVALDAWQRDVHDRHVHEQHERGDADP